MLIGEIPVTRDQHEPAFDAVRETVYPDFNLEEFVYYFDYVSKKCELLEPLWRV